jgi:acetyltransferase
MSPRSRYLRFAAPMPSMSEPLLDQMMRLDASRHVVYAALTLDEMAIVGVARFVRTDQKDVAEAAITIADDWQGHGLGFELLRSIVEHARAADIERLIATTLSENGAALRLARATGFSVSRRAGIYIEHEIDLRRL